MPTQPPCFWVKEAPGCVWERMPIASWAERALVLVCIGTGPNNKQHGKTWETLARASATWVHRHASGRLHMDE